VGRGLDNERPDERGAVVLVTRHRVENLFLAGGADVRELAGADAVDLPLVERGRHVRVEPLEQRLLEAVPDRGDPQGRRDARLVDLFERLLDHPVFLDRRYAVHHAVARERLALPAENAGRDLDAQLQQGAIPLHPVEDDVIVPLGVDHERFDQADGLDAAQDAVELPLADLPLAQRAEADQRDVQPFGAFHRVLPIGVWGVRLAVTL
jgi:hypothetical protein